MRKAGRWFSALFCYYYDLDTLGVAFLLRCVALNRCALHLHSLRELDDSLKSGILSIWVLEFDDLVFFLVGEMGLTEIVTRYHL